jgi:uncharacterized membrane protein YsdA (DUF1294 family)
MMACVLLGVTLLTSVFAACAIAYDKRQARLGKWRVRENTLHLLELLGGWPGSLIARHVLRHKTRDARYRLKAGAIVLAHVTAWVMVVWWMLAAR